MVGIKIVLNWLSAWVMFLECSWILDKTQPQRSYKKGSYKKSVAYNTRYSQAINRPGTYLAWQSYTAVIGREPVFSL